MSVMVQIRNVPDDLHRRLKARAALAGKSLSSYLLEELTLLAEKPSLEELRTRIEGRRKTDPVPAAADAVRAERKL